MSTRSIEHYGWQRFTRKQRLLRYVAYLGAALLLSWSMRTVDVFWPWVWDAPSQIQDLFRRMFPPNVTHLGDIVRGMLESIHIATIATLVAIVMAFPVALISAQNISHSRVLYWFGRVIIVSSRSIDTLIWALLFVAIFGPGPLTGIIAVAFRSIGFLAKLISESIEEIDWKPIEALQASGASRMHVLVYGIIPQIVPTFLAVAILRWDINIRESTVLGLVGAGGIGFLLQVSIDIFAWRTTATILIAIFIVVIFGEVVSGALRKKIL